MRLRRDAETTTPADDQLSGGGVATLEQQSEPIDNIAPDKPSRLQSILQFELTKGKVKRKDLMHFSRQMAVFIQAGIPILEALSTITEEMGNKRFKEVLLEMMDDLQAGLTFSGAADNHPDVFPEYYRGILKSAELTGSLDTVLVQLSDYIERDIEARRRVQSALTYPGVVIAMSMVVVVVLTAYVLPKFEDFFEDLDAELPLPTRMLLAVSHFLTTYWYFILAGIVLLIVGFIAAMRTERGRNVRDKTLLGAPVLGDLVHTAILERFCRILSSMVSAGVPLPEALAVTNDATNNHVFKTRLAVAREAMLRGEGLAAPLSATGLFPAAARQMFTVGESTGSLDKQLGIAATYFDRELDYKLKRFTDLFEPAVLIGVGLVVGFVAVALVSAMYGIFRQVH
jgi:type IV pilus assembly protein PilC